MTLWHCLKSVSARSGLNSFTCSIQKWFMIITSDTIKASRASSQTSRTWHACASRGTMSQKTSALHPWRMQWWTHPIVLVYYTEDMDTEETTHHIFQGCVIDPKTSSTETVSFERQSIRTTQHVTHCMDTTRRHRAWYNVLVEFSVTLMRRSRTVMRRRSVKARIPGDVLRCAGHHLVLEWRHVLEVAGTLCIICLLEHGVSE